MIRIVMTIKVTSMENYDYPQVLKKYSVIANEKLHEDEDINTTEAFFPKNFISAQYGIGC